MDGMGVIFLFFNIFLYVLPGLHYYILVPVFVICLWFFCFFFFLVRVENDEGARSRPTDHNRCVYKIRRYR